MKVEVLKCPSCGANIDVDENCCKTKCAFCNTILLIKKDAKGSYQDPIEDPLTEVTIYRKIGLTGGACKMICYIDGKEECRLKEGESYLHESILTNITFQCRLTMGNLLSDEVKIDLMRGNVRIEAKQGIAKPSIKVIYLEEKK